PPTPSGPGGVAWWSRVATRRAGPSGSYSRHFRVSDSTRFSPDRPRDLPRPVVVGFGVNLRHVGFAVAQDDLTRLQSKARRILSCRGRAQWVRRPGFHACSLASPADRSSEATGRQGEDWAGAGLQNPGAQDGLAPRADEDNSSRFVMFALV